MSEERASGPSARSLARVRKFVASYVAPKSEGAHDGRPVSGAPLSRASKGTYVLYPEPEVVENVVRGLAKNLDDHGKMYCPCAPVEESKARGAEMVCPCTPHHADIARQGYCDCALFASREFVAAERLRKSAAGFASDAAPDDREPESQESH